MAYGSVTMCRLLKGYYPHYRLNYLCPYPNQSANVMFSQYKFAHAVTVTPTEYPTTR